MFNKKIMKTCNLLFGVIILISSVSFAETNEVAKPVESASQPLSAREFEQLCDRVTFLVYADKPEGFDKARELKEISEVVLKFEKILNEQGTNYLQNIYYDGISGMFVYYEALMHQYSVNYHSTRRSNYSIWITNDVVAHKTIDNYVDTNTLKLIKKFSIIARQQGYDDLINMQNPERFVWFLLKFKAFEAEFQKNFEEKTVETAEIYDEVWNIFPYFRREMLNVWQEKLTNNIEQTLEIAKYVIEYAPYIDVSFYREAGNACMLKENYREAFKWWLDELKVPTYEIFQGFGRYSDTSRSEINFIKYIEYAEDFEFKNFVKFFRWNALRYPALYSNREQIQKWLYFEDEEQKLIDFDFNLRKIIESNEKNEIIEQLKEGIRIYRKVFYVEKLAEYEPSFQLNDRIINVLCNEAERSMRITVDFQEDQNIFQKIDKYLKNATEDGTNIVIELIDKKIKRHNKSPVIDEKIHQEKKEFYENLIQKYKQDVK